MRGFKILSLFLSIFVLLFHHIMNAKIIFAITFLLTLTHVLGQTSTSFTETETELKTVTGTLYGTLTLPQKFKKGSVALLIAGSGPTDRNGNNVAMENNSLKNLAHDLANKGIASLRYDKRGIGASKDAMTKEEDLRFDDLVNDAKSWISQLKKDKRFKKIVVIGHSEGSLIGMLAAKDADQFISLAGVGQSADKTLKEQLSSQPQMLKDIAYPILDSLKAGKTVDKVNPMLQALFRKSVQPYLISWFKYDPAQELKNLNKPILIIQGDKDIQVSVQDAELLAKAVPSSKLVIIEKMNHIFKIIEGDKKENIASYKDPNLPNAPKLIEELSKFILK